MSTAISIITTSKDSDFKTDQIYTGKTSVTGEHADNISARALEDYARNYSTVFANKILYYCIPQRAVCKSCHITNKTKTDFGFEYDFSARFELE